MEVPDFAAFHQAGKLTFHDVRAEEFVRLTRHPATEPYFGKHRSGRFDDPSGEFGVMYVAESLEVAFAETVLHDDSQFVDGTWLVSQGDLTSRHVAVFTREEPLHLLELFGFGLKKLGLANEVSAGSAYGFTQALSRAVHEAIVECDGILYASRQLNVGLAAVLFERSRVKAAATTALPHHPHFKRIGEAFGAIYLPAATES